MGCSDGWALLRKFPVPYIILYLETHSIYKGVATDKLVQLFHLIYSEYMDIPATFVHVLQ